MLSVLEQYQSMPDKLFLENRDAQLAAEHALLIAIQSVLDLGSHILADKGVQNISSDRDVLLQLGKVKVLPRPFAEEIANMAGFRNRLIHEYEDVNPQKVHDFLKNRLKGFQKFLSHIGEHFKL
jgi:uncharacterized protein YutE (UPF0331/DUF86 family)